MQKRNNLVEFARFVFSLLVVGYHVQAAFLTGDANVFENGALAVEFFFLLSGLLFASSLEKINARPRKNVFLDGVAFMKGKIFGVLPPHLVAVIAMIILTVCFNSDGAGKIIVDGLPSVFLVHMAVVWNDSFSLALIVPEWYLSAMLISMLFMIAVAIPLRKKIRGEFVTLVLIGALLVILLVYGLATNWRFTQNFIFVLRAWGEMCVGMFAYYLSAFLKEKETPRVPSAVWKAVEIVCYIVPMILGIVPISTWMQGACMGVTVVCIFIATTITFSRKGVSIKHEKINATFGFFGSISLAVYLFHPVVIKGLEYGGQALPVWSKCVIVYTVAIVGAVAYRLLAILAKRLLPAMKSRSEELAEQTL